MSQQFKNVWITIAGNSKRIKERHLPPHWRYIIEGNPEQFQLVSWILVGEATAKNNTQGTNPDAKNDEFLAWVKFFGNVSITEEGIATIHLAQP